MLPSLSSPQRRSHQSHQDPVQSRRQSPELHEDPKSTCSGTAASIGARASRPGDSGHLHHISPFGSLFSFPAIFNKDDLLPHLGVSAFQRLG